MSVHHPYSYGQHSFPIHGHGHGRRACYTFDESVTGARTCEGSIVDPVTSRISVQVPGSMPKVLQNHPISNHRVQQPITIVTLKPIRFLSMSTSRSMESRTHGNYLLDIAVDNIYKPKDADPITLRLGLSSMKRHDQAKPLSTVPALVLVPASRFSRIPPFPQGQVRSIGFLNISKYHVVC